MKKDWVEASEFLRNPSMVGSPFAATKRMVRRVLEPLNWQRFDLVVEYGPGSGRFTFEILKRLHPDARFVAIETSATFARRLRSKCNDPRLVVIEGSAQDVRKHLDDLGLRLADCILTGLPFSTLDRREAADIMRKTALSLKPDGVLAAYQMRTAIRPLIEKNFQHFAHGYEWWNIPPCHLYWARKPVPADRQRDSAELMSPPLTTSMVCIGCVPFGQRKTPGRLLSRGFMM